ncbi:hypothetical protein EDB84DRAFT_1608777 [Lactarius hengduanensis]|nr:hypothetical protein EDB84DRAFT_1608777 [Lactarius hengduanensis]
MAMAPAPPQIVVYALLPLKVVHDADLNLCPSNWEWVHCLTFPLEMLVALHFSHRPFKWVQYAIGVIIGAHGDLSTSPDLPNDSVDYNANLPTNSVNLYYHTNDQEKQRMFPIDPHILRTQDTTSVSSSRRGTFRKDVAARDGQRCVWTGWDVEGCDAVHLIPHSKSDKYILNFTRHCERGDKGDDIITDIDSVRNGILLNKVAHRTLGKNLAFLMTPNFAMDTSDIDHDAPPDQKRCTAHLIQVNGPYPREFVSGSLVQITASSQFRPPPDILFDAVYATFILHHFGTKRVKDRITKEWNDTLYSVTDEHATTSERTSAQDERRTKHRRPDIMGMLMALPYILVPPDKLQAEMRAAKEEAEAAEQSRVQERVEGWIKQVNAA